MIVKAKTEYTMELLKKFTKFNSLKNRSQIITYCLLELTMLGLAGVSIYNAITGGSTEDTTLAIVCTFIFPFIVPLTLLLLPSLTAKMSKNVIGAVNLYEFNDDEIVIESSLTAANGKTNANYSFIDILYETRDTFYLYISKQQAFIIRKADIIEGNVSSLQDLFKKNLQSNKYIVKRF